MGRAKVAIEYRARSAEGEDPSSFKSFDDLDAIKPANTTRVY
jgi:hypothetical protein